MLNWKPEQDSYEMLTQKKHYLPRGTKSHLEITIDLSTKSHFKSIRSWKLQIYRGYIAAISNARHTALWSVNKLNNKNILIYSQFLIMNRN